MHACEGVGWLAFGCVMTANVCMQLCIWVCMCRWHVHVGVPMGQGCVVHAREMYGVWRRKEMRRC